MGERKFTESQAERIELFQDVYEGRIPKRVPVEVSVSWEAAIRYSGLELKEAQWNTEAVSYTHLWASPYFSGASAAITGSISK